MRKALRLFAVLLLLAAALFLLFSCRARADYLIGDVNGDGAVNGRDSLVLLRYVDGEREDISKGNSDLTFDGTLTSQDCQVLSEFLAELSRPGTRFSLVTLNALPISDYTVIIPENATDFEKYTADILTEYVSDICGERLTVKSDKTGETPCEILIGATNRAESAQEKAADLADGEYIIYSKGSRIALLGKNYSVGGGVGWLTGELSRSSVPWNSEAGVNIPHEAAVRCYTPEKATGVILFIGDGMGKNTVKLAYTSGALTLGADGTAVPLDKDDSGIGTFWAELFPAVGDAVTLNYDGTVTDSAASGTALATGHKTKNGVLGMIPADLDGDGVFGELSSVQNVREMAALSGRMTAVLSTDRVTGATPNAFLVHHSYRYDSDIVLEQQEALQSGRLACDVLWCEYDSDDAEKQLIGAISTINNSDNGFFIMCEEAMIDKYASKLDYQSTARCVRRLNDMVAYAATYALCHTDTAVIITADHETGGLAETENAGQSLFAWTSGGDHTAANVPVYAIGAGTEIFAGQTVDNTAVAQYISSIVE